MSDYQYSFEKLVVWQKERGRERVKERMGDRETGRTGERLI